MKYFTIAFFLVVLLVASLSFGDTPFPHLAPFMPITAPAKPASALPPGVPAPIAAIAVTQCTHLYAIWLIWPTKTVRFDADSPPSDAALVIALMNAAASRDVLDIACKNETVL